MVSCFKRKREVKKHELTFMGLVTEGCYGSPHLLDEVYEKAKDDDETDQIFGARDDDGDLPIHKACSGGNPTCL